jgi:hypothetical protein
VSDEARYESQFGAGQVKVEHWLAEFLCARQARSKNVELPPKFWSHPQYKTIWERCYKQQLRAALALLRLYSPRAISAALRSKEGKKVLSLAAPWFDPLVQAEQHKLDVAERLRQDQPAEPVIPEPPVQNLKSIRPPFVLNRSILERLDEG